MSSYCEGCMIPVEGETTLDGGTRCEFCKGRIY